MMFKKKPVRNEDEGWPVSQGATWHCRHAIPKNRSAGLQLARRLDSCCAAQGI